MVRIEFDKLDVVARLIWVCQKFAHLYQNLKALAFFDAFGSGNYRQVLLFQICHVVRVFDLIDATKQIILTFDCSHNLTGHFLFLLSGNYFLILR
jgi:hypothetical protein